MRTLSLLSLILLLAAPGVSFARGQGGAAAAARHDDPAPDGEAGAPAEEAPTTDEAPPAEEAEPSEPSPKDTKPEKTEKAVPAVGATSASDYGVNDSAVPPGGRMEWAERRQIRVIQKRDMLKEGRHQFSILGGVVPNDDFFAYIDAGLAYDYYFSEDIALELRGAYTVPQKTALEQTLTQPRPDGPGLEVRLPQTLNAHVSASAAWNLLHGKLGFFSTRLTEFDLGLVFGIGAVLTEIQGKATEQNTKKFSPAGNVGAVLQFYLGSRFALRVDYRQFFYPADGGGVSFPISTTLGLSYFTAPIE